VAVVSGSLSESAVERLTGGRRAPRTPGRSAFEKKRLEFVLAPVHRNCSHSGPRPLPRPGLFRDAQTGYCRSADRSVVGRRNLRHVGDRHCRHGKPVRRAVRLQIRCTVPSVRAKADWTPGNSHVAGRYSRQQLRSTSRNHGDIGVRRSFCPLP
jgi:hypothetical protein